MDFETVLLSLIGLLALIAGGCLLSLWTERRRRRASSPFAKIPTRPAPARQKLPAPTVDVKTDGRDHSTAHKRQADFQQGLGLRAGVTVAERPSIRRAAMTIAEDDRRTNHRMF